MLFLLYIYIYILKICYFYDIYIYFKNMLFLLYIYIYFKNMLFLLYIYIFFKNMLFLLYIYIFSITTTLLENAFYSHDVTLFFLICTKIFEGFFVTTYLSDN